MSWLIAPNGLIVEHAAVPEVSGPPPPRPGRSGAAPGEIHTADDGAVAAECEKANAGLAWLKKEGEVQLVTAVGGGVVPQPACAETLARLRLALGVKGEALVSGSGSDDDDGVLMDQQRVQQGVIQRMYLLREHLRHK